MKISEVQSVYSHIPRPDNTIASPKNGRRYSEKRRNQPWIRDLNLISIAGSLIASL